MATISRCRGRLPPAALPTTSASRDAAGGRRAPSVGHGGLTRVCHRVHPVPDERGDGRPDQRDTRRTWLTRDVTREVLRETLGLTTRRRRRSGLGSDGRTCGPLRQPVRHPGDCLGATAGELVLRFHVVRRRRAVGPAAAGPDPPGLLRPRSRGRPRAAGPGELARGVRSDPTGRVVWPAGRARSASADG
jgi:hypothetical protein